MRPLVAFLLICYSAIPAEEPISTILFGSCIKQEKPVPIFDAILERSPEVFLFLGDNIYADTEDMAVMRAKYAELGSKPGFIELKKNCPILAVWDDHDYGVNDGGAEYPKRVEAQKEFLDFWSDEDGIRFDREGVYSAHLFGPESTQVQIILLDTRYFRGPLKTGERRVGGKYYPSDDTSIPMLGEAQWQWLEEQLKKPAKIRLIGSGIQIVPESAGQETWSNLPHERQRLFDLIAKTKAEGVILLSGDRHWSEFSRTEEGTPYPIYDFTSSSLNQVHPRGTPTKNRFRISETTYHEENFGEISIDWKGAGTLINVSIRDITGEVIFSREVSLSELKPK